MASAQKVQIDGVFYNLNPETKQAEVTSSNTKYSGTVSIPWSICHEDVNYNVTSIGTEAFMGCSELASVSIPDIVTSIGERAFQGCTGLTYFQMPSRVTSVGSNAFYGCTGLKDVFWEEEPEAWKKIKFTDKYSDPTANNNIHLRVVENVNNSVGFTPPVVIKAFEEEVVVSFNGTRFKTECHLEIPEAQDAQKYLAELLFGEKSNSLANAYNDFKTLWKQESVNSTKPVNGSIKIDLRKEYEHYGRYACYYVTASLNGRVQMSGHFQNELMEKKKTQYYKLVSGVDYHFIVDTQKKRMVGIRQIFIPELVEKVKEMFGNHISLYVEDRSLQLLSKKNDGRFILCKATEGNFTDYFKQLVSWDKIQNIDTPAFLHGQKGLEDVLKRLSAVLAYDEEVSDTVTVSLIVLEDGSVKQPTIESKPNNYDETKLLEACGKMPKWMPAYKDGNPITKEVFFSIKVPKVYDDSGNDEAFYTVDQMPSYPGGIEALKQFLTSHMRYPRECEENGIQGRPVCTFIVERDGTITDVRVTKSVHPLLDKEAMRIISLMPRWIPGKTNGKPVRVKSAIPLTFRLQ